MATSEHKQARWQEVLDGQKNWEQPKLCPGDDDKFLTEYVNLMKQLEADGCFEIAIITLNRRGRAKVPVAIRIVSAINYDCHDSDAVDADEGMYGEH
jgi:hypothetical protein